jgi:ubiquinone/menaquinone biosynthesis C-methylase UbiE
VKDTSWGNVADWYAEHVVGEDSYHRNVVLPNLLRMMNMTSGMHVLDVACGSGFFANEFKKAGARVTARDISEELILLAQKQYPGIDFAVAPAHKLADIEDQHVDALTIILAIQNIREVKETLLECSRVLKPGGKLYIVMNHPAFRIPGGSSWGWDTEKNIQYRRIDEYMSEKKVPIVMHPGSNPNEKTISFHRPLQFYAKLIGSSGLAISKIEEWISHRKSEEGPRQKEEDRTRKEIPLFMVLEVIKIRV